MTAIDPASLELLRESLIAAAAASAPNAITLPIARNFARINGHKVDDDRLLRELHFLASSGLLESQANPLSGASVLYRITSDGMLFAESKGLA